MGRQRRDVVPKCARHSQSELMFCETCDVVFCVDCAGTSHAGASASSSTPGPISGPSSQVLGGPGGATASAHTVIPFSIAIKRMSEILLYKVSIGTTFTDIVTARVARMHRFCLFLSVVVSCLLFSRVVHGSGLPVGRVGSGLWSKILGCY